MPRWVTRFPSSVAGMELVFLCLEDERNSLMTIPGSDITASFLVAADAAAPMAAWLNSVPLALDGHWAPKVQGLAPDLQRLYERSRVQEERDSYLDAERVPTISYLVEDLPDGGCALIEVKGGIEDGHRVEVRRTLGQLNLRQDASRIAEALIRH